MKPALVRLAMVAVALGAVARPASAASPAGTPDLAHVTPAERAAYIRRAAVWQRTDIPSMDLLAGPRRKDAFTFDQKVACDYVVPAEPLGGATPKFMCAIESSLHAVRVLDAHGNDTQ